MGGIKVGPKVYGKQDSSKSQDFPLGGHPLMMSESRGREGVHEIRTSVIRVSTQNSDKREGGGPKTVKKFGHH